MQVRKVGRERRPSWAVLFLHEHITKQQSLLGFHVNRTKTNRKHTSGSLALFTELNYSNSGPNVLSFYFFFKEA